MNIASKALLWGCILTLFSLPAFAFAGGGPENVLLVVNANSDSSKMIANWYIHGRGIPSQNVVYLDSVPPREITSRGQFVESILNPILSAMRDRKITAGIDYIVYSSDFPTAVLIHQDRANLLEQIPNLPKEVKRLFSHQASISSLTYYAVAVLGNSPGYMLLDSNHYYRKPAAAILERPFIGPRQKEFHDAAKVLSNGTDSQLQESIDTLLEMAKKNPRQLGLAYWIARFYGQKGDFQNASKWLQQSIRLGWRFKKITLADPAFKAALKDPLFKGFADRVPDSPFDFVPSRGFKSHHAFGPNGFPNNEVGQGNRHFLCTVLAVTRNLGTTEAEALQQLKSSMAADGTQPQGTFYFSDNGDVRTKARKPGYAPAIAVLESLGHKTKIIKEDVPANADDVIGLSCGKHEFSFKRSGSKIVPGAICENLTSWGGVMAGRSHYGISELIRCGAAGSSGTVIEPFSVQAKFPHPMIHAHYARGCSLAESFYQSLHGPFQLLIVGDALCQPWAVKPEFTVRGIAPGETISGKRELKIDLSKSPVRVQGMELYVDGKRVARTQFKETVKFDATSMTDGFHEIRVVLIAQGQIETVGNMIIPFQVDNFGKQTSLVAKSSSFNLSDRITFVAKSNFGDAIELRHNSRSLGKKSGQEAQFTVSASTLGRGPVKLVAVALSEEGNKVVSAPLELEITGRISTTKVDTEPQLKPKPKPKRLPPKAPAK